MRLNDYSDLLWVWSKMRHVYACFFVLCVPAVVLFGIGLGELSAPCVRSRVLSFTVYNNRSITAVYQNDVGGQRACIVPIEGSLPARVDSICHSLIFPKLCRFDCTTSVKPGLAYLISGATWFCIMLCFACISCMPRTTEPTELTLPPRFIIASNQVAPTVSATDTNRARTDAFDSIAVARISIEGGHEVQLGKGDFGSAHVVVINPS